MSEREVNRPWLGQLTLGAHWATWRGRIGDSQIHRHLAAHAVFAEQPIGVLDGAGRLRTGRCVLIDPLAPHCLVTADVAELVFAEPRGVEPPADLRARFLDISRVEPPIVLRSTDPRLRYWPDTLASMDSGPPAHPGLPRLEPSLRQIDRLLDQGAIQLADLAGRAGLSTERFRHLFAEVLGVPFRRYVLWRRIGRAVSLLNGGHSVTAAAHASGFADGAHFARTMKVMFGVAPSALGWSPTVRC